MARLDFYDRLLIHSVLNNAEYARFISPPQCTGSLCFHCPDYQDKQHCDP